MSKIEKITKQLQHEQADAAWITTSSQCILLHWV